MPRRTSRLGKPWRTRKRRKFLGHLKRARDASRGLNNDRTN